MNWSWQSFDHWGFPITPTGFTIERELGAEDWELLSFSIPPAGRSYIDVLDQETALAVFGAGLHLAYRVKAYLIV